MYCSPTTGGGSSYEIRDFKVFFETQYVPHAKWIDFKDLGQGYGKDGNYVFFRGQIVHQADPISFQVIDDAYAKDHQYVFQYGRIVDRLQSSSFHPQISSTYPMHTPMATYEIHDFKVFFGGKYLRDARWIDFTNLGQGYGKDIHHVFFMGDIVEDANAFSFEVLNKGYAKDKHYVFYNGQIVQDLKPFGFQAPSDH